MKTIIGTPARKERFYPRPDIRAQILEAVENGENVLLSAPRRVGKTSIMYDLIDNADESVYAVYMNSEHLEDPEKFFQLMLEKVLNVDFWEGFGKFSRSTVELFKKWGNKVAGVTIAGVVEVDISKSSSQSYYDQLLDFLKDIKLEGKKILVMVDEFPTTLEHITKKHGVAETQRFLNQNRALRQTVEFQDKIKFLYTGSIGLYSAVKKIKAVDRINDLREIKVSVLKPEEAEELAIALLSEKTGFKPNLQAVAYILNKIEWWIPFYFQLLVVEIALVLQENSSAISNENIDNAFLKVVENGNLYFEPFKSRLFKTLDETHQPFVFNLLLTLKDSDMDLDFITNLSVNFNVHENLEDILEVLKHDGYIVQDKNLFKFYSPILKYWWR